jgi:hypothetical protein
MKKLLLIPLFFSSLFANPFTIDMPIKEQLEDADFIILQEKAREIDLTSLIDSLYPTPSFWRKNPLQKKSDFSGRIHRAARQTFIDVAQNKLPQKKLIPINGGGDNCIVSFASYDGVYASLLESIPSLLEKTGFKGHFLMLLGGYPNPTGKEPLYSATPYAFKIFSMLEAKKLGFHKVLWIDASFIPLQDPTPLFNWIEKEGCFFHPKKNNNRYLLPKTRDILLEKTGVDMYKTPCIRARVMGLDFSLEKVKKLIEEYYALVALGTPFLSCFPEEFVIGSLLAKSPSNWPAQPFSHLVKNARKMHGKDIDCIKKEGFFFLLEQH